MSTVTTGIAVGLIVAAGPAAGARAKGPGATKPAAAGAPVPAPFATAPQPWPSDTLVPANPPFYLPPAKGADLPRRGEAATQNPLPRRPVKDRATHVWTPDTLGPRPFLRPSAPAARAASPDPAKLSASWGRRGPDGARAAVASDPTLDRSHRAAVTAVPRLREKPVPFVRLVIPDPFELAEAVGLHAPPPDDAPPAPPADPPAVPKLSVSAKR